MPVLANDSLGRWAIALPAPGGYALPAPFTLRCLVMGGTDYQVVGGMDMAEGTPTPPSLRMDSWGYWRFRWAVRIGTRTIGIAVKQAANLTPRPSMIVKANPAIGVNADVSGTAAAGTGWVTIGPLTIVPTSDGAVEVQLWNNLDTQIGTTPCYFDTETLGVT